jgi:Carboxypeptidase regulatory-like domain
VGLRQWLIIGALGSLLVGCESLSGPSRYETRVHGSVFDSAFRPLPGTRVEILDGPRAGASMSTGANGAFEFGGSARGAVRLRVSRDGFESATIATVWEPDPTWISLYLKSLEPTLPITPGSYTLTVTSHPSATGRAGISRFHSGATSGTAT